jgi:hypothetical protein
LAGRFFGLVADTSSDRGFGFVVRTLANGFLGRCVSLLAGCSVAFSFITSGGFFTFIQIFLHFYGNS